MDNRNSLRYEKALLLAMCVCAMVSVTWLHYRADSVMIGWRRYVHNWVTPATFPDPEPQRVLWSVNLTRDRHPDEVHHVFFVKVHKAASSTLTNLFTRFSLSRQLNVMFPHEEHILSEKSPHLLSVMDHPPSPPFAFDIVCNHVVFHRNLTYLHLLPQDAVYISILRKPLRQIHSAYDYFRNTHFSEEYLMRSSNFSDFMSRQAEYEHQDPYYSFTNNRMSLDLGLPVHQLRNTSYIPTFLKEVEDIFDLILIVEQFDESIILLKRRLKWTMKDMLYISSNTRDAKENGPPKLDPITENKFKQFDQFDIALYDHFLKRFEERVREAGPDFQEEVQAYRDILQMVHKFCKGFDNTKHIVIPSANGAIRL